MHQGAHFEIRRLRPEDAEAYRPVRLAGLAQHPEAFGTAWDEEQPRPLDWFAERIAGNRVFGAWSATALLGVAGLMVPSGVKLRHRGVLWGMFVQPAARGTGAAAALVATVIDAAQGLVEEIDLTVTASNERAIRLYRAAGFEPYALDERALKVAGQYYDDILMRLRLPPQKP